MIRQLLFIPTRFIVWIILCLAKTTSLGYFFSLNPKYDVMYNICFTLLLLLNLVAVISNAQILLGIGGGYTANTLSSDLENRSFSESKAKAGYLISLTSFYSFKRDIDLRIDCSFIQKNTLAVRTGPYSGMFDSNRNSYVQVPFTIHICSNRKKLNGFIDFGVYGGYWILGRSRGQIANIFDITDSADLHGKSYQYLNFATYKTRYRFNKKKDNRIEAGWLIRLGLTLSLGNYYSFFLEGGFYRSFTDQQKKYMLMQVPRYNTTYTVSLGTFMILNRKKDDKMVD